MSASQRRIDGGVYAEIKKHKADGFHLQRIETGLTGSGVPDVNYATSPSIEGWIEAKKSLGWTVKFRPEQVGWHLTRARLGCRTFIAVRQLGPGRDSLWLVPGRLAGELALSGLKGKAFLPYLLGQGGPENWPWQAFWQALRAKSL